MENADLPERQAERIRGDLRHYRFQALPERGRADIHRHHTVRLQFQARRLLRPGAASLDKAGDGDTVIAAVDLAPLQSALFFPAELGKAAVERLAIVAAVAFGIDRRAPRLQPGQPVRHFRRADQIAPPHLDAVDPEIARRQFDQPLAEE